MPETTIDIHHVIFTRVERQFSPRHISGYQIVYQSPALGSETGQIEKRLQCFQPGSEYITRYQFFWTDKRQVVLSKSVPLFRPSREVIDWDQRDAFLAHALVLSASAFAEVHNDPFAIFDITQALFTTNEEQLRSYLQHPPHERLRVSPRYQPETSPLEHWPVSELGKLNSLGLQAATMTQQARSIALLDPNPDEVYRLLRALFPLLRPRVRAECTFDTFADGCLPAPGTFWAIGCVRSPGNPGLLPIQLARRYINTQAVSNDAQALQEKVYSTWLSYVLEKVGGFQQVNVEVISAQIIAEAFLEKKPLSTNNLNEHAISHFYEANEQFITQTLSQMIRSVFDDELAARIVDATIIYLPKLDRLSIVACGFYSSRTLAWVIYYWRLQSSSEFEYWKELFKFAEQADYPPLLLMASLKIHSWVPFTGNENARMKSLGSLGRSAQLLETLSELLGEQRPGLVNRFELTDEEFSQLVSALLEKNYGDVLGGAFVRRLKQVQNAKKRRELMKTIKNTKNVSQAFRHALEI